MCSVTVNQGRLSITVALTPAMTSTVPTVVNNRINPISLLAIPCSIIKIDRFFFATFIDRAAISEMPASIKMIPNFFMTSHI